MQNLLSARSRGVQRLRRLARRRSSRSEEGAFVVEGGNLVNEALASDAELESLYVEVYDDDQISESVKGYADRATARGLPVHWLAPGVLGRATTTVTAQPVAAIARTCDLPIETLVAEAAPSAPLVVLVDLQDPGNAGTLLRASEAAGAEGAVLCGDCVDLFNPKVVRASAGTIFHLPVAQGGEPGEVLSLLRSSGRRTLGMVSVGGRAYDRVDLTSDVAIVLGNESHGLSDDVAREVDEILSIPMVGRSESLNVGVAGAIALFEALRQRREQAG